MDNIDENSPAVKYVRNLATCTDATKSKAKTTKEMATCYDVYSSMDVVGTLNMHCKVFLDVFARTLTEAFIGKQDDKTWNA